MFSEAFRQTPTAGIIEDLQERGVFAMERVLPAETVDQLLADVDDLQPTFNRNVPPNVVAKGQTYANHYLARSRTAFDLVTSRQVTDILRAGLGDVFRMVGKRIYETRDGYLMPFHSDNGSACDDPRRLDTIVFIFYLNDVEQGEWEIVEGSHLWGDARIGSLDMDKELLDRPDVMVRGFKMPKGSLVIYNGRTLHRAKTFDDPNWARRSLFFQVNRNSRDGEPILVNTGFITPDLSEDAKMLLGFGQKSSMRPYPVTSMGSVPVGRYKSVDDYLLTLPISKLAALDRQRQATES